MITNKQFRVLALSFHGTIESPHFHRASFRITKKIFATLDENERTASVKLTEADQGIFSKLQDGSIYPVPNKWGRQGWTVVELKKVRKSVLQDVLSKAYCSVAPKKYQKLYCGTQPENL